MINIDAGEVAALPVDQLGLAILDDLIATGAWNEYNYLLEAGTITGPDRCSTPSQKRWVGCELER